MNYERIPGFEKTERITREYAYLDLETRELRGKASFDGQKGGFPLMYDKESKALVVDPTDSHTVVFGSSGSKKTRLVVLPAIHTLAAGEESMIIHDPKAELFARTAGMLKSKGYRVISINLRDPSVGDSWNPLTIPYSYFKQNDIDKACELVNDVAHILMRKDQIVGDRFWIDSASSTCYGLILLLFRYCRDMNLPDSAVNIANLIKLREALFDLSNKQKPSQSWLWKWGAEDELVAAALRGTVTTAEETMQGVLSTLDQELRRFMIKPTLLNMLSNNTFDMEQIGKEKTCVFLITPDEKSSAFRALVSLFIAQSYQYLIYSAEKSGGRVERRINYLLDEFSSLPEIGDDSFPSMVTAARSRNIRFLIVLQSLHQLSTRYREEAQTIMANCSNWLCLFTRELELLKQISELCGQRKKDGKANISVYDLQHLSKEKNECLLLAGRMKPAVVRLLDIKKLDHDRPLPCEMETPLRMERIRIDFSKITKKIKTAGSKAAESATATKVSVSVPACGDQSPDKDVLKAAGSFLAGLNGLFDEMHDNA